VQPVAAGGFVGESVGGRRREAAAAVSGRRCEAAAANETSGCNAAFDIVFIFKIAGIVGVGFS